MRAILIEDEQPSLALMERMTERNGQLELVGAYTDAAKALEELQSLAPDVVFADVEMPEMNGLELAREVKRRDPEIQVVFVTAHEQYAVQAFQIEAVNYILKPITEEDLNATVNRLMKSRRMFPKEQDARNRIRAFGGLEVFGEKAVRWPTAKARELFACFVLERGKPLSKWRLCERLWPESPPQKAEHSLHSAVSRVKLALQEAGVSDVLFCEKGEYWMKPDAFSCDAWEFEAFLRSSPTVGQENLLPFEKALGLYEGELFGAEDYLWCAEARARMDRLYLDGLKKMGRCCEEQQKYGKAEETLQKAAEADPFDEEALGLLLLTYFSMGNKEKLVGCYRKFEQNLQEELHISPTEETARLYETLLGGL